MFITILCVIEHLAPIPFNKFVENRLKNVSSVKLKKPVYEQGGTIFELHNITVISSLAALAGLHVTSYPLFRLRNLKTASAIH